MLTLPKKLYRIHHFEIEGQKYIADLDNRRVVPCNEILLEVLNYVESSTVFQIVEALKDIYGEEKVFKALEQLERLTRQGLILSSVPPNSVSQTRQRYRLFLTHDLLYSLPPQKDTENALQNYLLVTTLAQHVDILFGIPEEKSDELSFHESGVIKVPMKSGRIYSPLRYTQDCDFALALSPGKYEDLPFFCGSTISVIARIHSSGGKKEILWDSILAKAALMRDYDALVVDASWVKAELSILLPEVKNVFWIPDGVNFDFFKPGDQAESKAELIKLLEFPQGKVQPILGLILGQNRKQNLWTGIHLAQRHPEWWIVVFDESFYHRLPDAPENLRFFGARLYEDLRLLPMIFNGIDGLFFCATTGTPASWLMEAMACETPIILASRVPISELGGDFPRIDLASHPIWEDQIHLMEIEEKFTNLISKSELTLDFSKRTRERALQWNWNQVSMRWIKLLDELKTHRRINMAQKKANIPILFSRCYEKGENKFTTQAISLSSLTPYSLIRGLSWDLKKEHTLTEVRSVLQRIFGDSEEVKKISDEWPFHLV